MSPSANDPNIEPYAEPQAPPPAAPAKPPEPDPQIAALQKEVEDLRGLVAESNRTAEFWAAKARETSAAPAQRTVPPEPEEEDDTDVLEAITTNGTKGFDALAQKRGFVRRDDVQRMIDERTASVTKEQELLGRYPDLKDRNSDFFKMTANHYGQLVKDGTPMRAAMEIAAEKTELEFMRSGKPVPGSKGDRETERLARIAAQGGGAGPRRPAADEEDENNLTAEQKHIAHMMGISEEAYLKRAKQGVRMGGKPANR